MTFGKKGRPAEDRLLRQREIYNAVSPLIEQVGARRLSMRQAAQAACLSLGGLYHYFPTKRDLVLHGVCPEALRRLCEDFHAEFGHLAQCDPQRYMQEGVNIVVKQMAFYRPAVHAALELGNESFWEVIETLLTSTSLQFEERLQMLYPAISEDELQQWGQAIRRAICAAMLDKRMKPNQLRDELHMLVAGFANRATANGHVHAGAMVV
jgi:AcrR family transcriptional regulator